MPKFLDVTDKQAALAAIGLRKFYVDNYGADPTGATSSNAAVAAALADMGSDPGTLVFGSGTYAISNTINIGPYQGIVGDVSGATVLRYTGNSDAIRVQDPRTWIQKEDQVWLPGGGPSGPGYSGGVRRITIDGSDAGASACGLHIGDVLAPDVDVAILRFDGANAKGLYCDNRVTWMEFAKIRAVIDFCTEAVVFDRDPTKPGGGFSYGEWTFFILALANQSGVRLSNGSVLGQLAGSGLTICGGFINDDSATNNGIVLHLKDNSEIIGQLNINVESSGGPGRLGHRTIVRTNGGLIRSTGTVNFYNGSVPFREGTIDTLSDAGSVMYGGRFDVDEGFGHMGKLSGHALRATGGISGQQGYMSPTGEWSLLQGNWVIVDLEPGAHNVTFYYGDAVPGRFQAATWDLFLKQPASGGPATLTWPSTGGVEFIWSGGSAPTLSTDPVGIDWIRVSTINFQVFFAEHVNAKTARVNVIQALGSATNIDVDVVAKGSGRLKAGGVNVPTVSSNDTLTNKTVTDGKFNQLCGPSGKTILNFVDDASSNSYLAAINSVGVAALEAQSTALSNVDLQLMTKGLGSFVLIPGNQGKVKFFAAGSANDIDFEFTPKNAGTVLVKGTPVATRLTNTATLDFGSVNAQSFADLTITVTGAATGDAVALGTPTAAITAGIAFTAWVSATDTVTVRAHNYTAGALDPASGTFRATIIR